MCQPFSAPNSDKLLKVKPSYCRISVASEKDMAAKCVHARGKYGTATACLTQQCYLQKNEVFTNILLLVCKFSVAFQ